MLDPLECHCRYLDHLNNLDDGTIGRVIVGEHGNFDAPFVAIGRSEPLGYNCLLGGLDCFSWAVWLHQYHCMEEGGVVLQGWGGGRHGYYGDVEYGSWLK